MMILHDFKELVSTGFKWLIPLAIIGGLIGLAAYLGPGDREVCKPHEKSTEKEVEE